MGVVYEAVHGLLKKRVAVKVISSAGVADDSVVERFLVEMEAIGQLNSPHVVAAHDAGNVDGVYYLVMEFVDGPNLRMVCKSQGRLSVADAMEVARQTAIGLEHAHELGLVHRDIKPSNLMLNSQGEVKVADLGLAKVVSQNTESGLTGAGGIVGTLNYIAPEQIEGETVDARTDLYSLGCTLYHLITGRPPFHGDKYGSAVRKMRAHTDDEAIPPSQLVEECGEEVDEIIARLMSKDPSKRWKSAGEFAESIAHYSAEADLQGLVSQFVQEATATMAASEVERATTRLTPPTIEAAPPPDRVLTSWRFWAVAVCVAALLGGGAWWWGTRPAKPIVTPTPVVDGELPTDAGPAVDPPVRKAVVIDYTSHPRGEWIDLIQSEPTPLFSVSSEENADSLVRGDKIVLSSADKTIYSLGSIAAPTYTLKFEVHQKRWYGGFGFFVGYQKMEPTPTIHAFDLQQIGPENRRTLALCRNFDSVHNAGNDDFVSGATFPCQPITVKGLKSQEVEIKIVNEEIESVLFNGERLHMLTHSSTRAAASQNPCRGQFGFRLNVTDAEITKAQLMIPKD